MIQATRPHFADTPPDHNRFRLGVIACTAVIVAAQCLALLRAATGEFISDDSKVAGSGSSLANIPWTRIYEIFVPRPNLWEFLPVRDLSMRLDIQLFGDDPLGYHLHNVLLYAICCWAVWFFTRRVLSQFGESGVRALAISGAATVIFAVHPAHVEAVAWISGRKDLLAGCFGFLSAILWMQSLDEKGGGGLTRGCSVLAYGVSLLAKSSTLPLPIIMALLTFIRLRRELGFRRSLARTTLLMLPFMCLGILGATINIWVAIDTGSNISGAAQSLDWWERSERAVLILGQLTRIAFLPVDLRFTYNIYDPGFLVQGYVLGVLAIIAMLWGIWRILCGRPSPVGLACAIFAPLTLPFLQLTSFYSSSMAAERFVFMPVVALALAAAVLAARLPFRWSGAALSLVAALGIWQSASRAADWTSSRRLLAQDQAHVGSYCYHRYLTIRQIQMRGGSFAEARAEAALVADPLMRQSMIGYVDSAEQVWRVRSGAPMKQATRRVLALDDTLWKIAALPPRDTTCQMVGAYLHQEVLEFYKILLRRRPGSPRLNLRIAKIFLKNRRDRTADIHLRRALAAPGLKGAERAAAWKEISGILMRRGQP